MPGSNYYVLRFPLPITTSVSIEMRQGSLIHSASGFSFDTVNKKMPYSLWWGSFLGCGLLLITDSRTGPWHSALKRCYQSMTVWCTCSSYLCTIQTRSALINWRSVLQTLSQRFPFNCNDILNLSNSYIFSTASHNLYFLIFKMEIDMALETLKLCLQTRGVN